MTEFRCGESDANYDTNDAEQFCIDGLKVCDGTVDCANGNDENRTICANGLCPKGTFRCRYGGCIPEEAQCDHFFDCLDGSDETSDLCIRIKCPECQHAVACPSLHHRNILSNRYEITCKWKGRDVSCADDILPGTEASYACKDFFRPARAKDAANDWNLCQADGTWLREPLQCKPDCGRHHELIPLITNGWQTGKTLPWHASLYRLGDNSEDEATLICGATLISESVVVTAAHCVWNMDIKQLRIALGSLKAAYDADDDLTARYYSVKAAYPHPLYFDRLGNFGSDIGIIELAERVEFDEFIAPVCIDWHSMYDLPSDAEPIGVVAGMGLSENGTVSDTIRVATMPIVTQKRCVDSFQTDFRKYLTFTTFCAGWHNGTNACNGDSGAGLVIPISRDFGRYYLHGVISLGAKQLTATRCDANQYTVLTKVPVYAKWIEDHVNRINRQHIL